MKCKYEFCAMQILLTAATVEEIEPTKNRFPELDVLISGVGTPSTLYHLQKRLHQVDYDFVIQAGIAGAFTTELNQGDTVLIKQDTFADLGTEEKNIFTPCFKSNLVNPYTFPFADGWLINSTTTPANFSLKWVKGVTVNKVSDNKIQKAQLLDAFDPQIESMEGAALHFVCLQENIPFLQIRSVSNYVGERDKLKWNLNEAIKNLNDELVKMINVLTK